MSRFRKEAGAVVIAAFGAAIAHLLTEAFYHWSMTESFIAAYHYSEIIALIGVAVIGGFLGVLILNATMLVARRFKRDRRWLPILIATCIFCLVPMLLLRSAGIALLNLPMAIVAGWLWRRTHRGENMDGRSRRSLLFERGAWTAAILLAGMAVVPPALASWRDEQAYLDPTSKPASLLGPRIMGGAIHGGELWLFNIQGVAASYRLSDWHPTRRAEQVADLKIDGNDIWILRAPPLQRRAHQPAGYFTAARFRDGRWYSFPEARYDIDARPIAFAMKDGRPIVIDRNAIHLLSADGKTWTSRKLDKSIEARGETSSAFGDSDTLYLGFNEGEWGGGILRIRIGSGATKAVGQHDTVTGLITDKDRPGCVLAAIGLSHFMWHGRIARICGDKVELVFERQILPIGVRIERMLSERKRSFPPQTEPIFGIVASRDGYWAVSPRGLYRKTAAGIERHDFPDLEEKQGLSVSTSLPGLAVVSTDVNAARSLSGDTPMLIGAQ